MNEEQKPGKIFYVTAVCLIIGISFYFLSPVTGYIFHSDIGVHILMTYDFRLPDDLYFWGQDRLGSIVPMFGHALYRLFHLSPIVAASVSAYFFLILGFLFLSTLFRTRLTKLIFALIWFLPVFAFQEQVELAQPYSAQVCFLGIMAWCFNRSVATKAAIVPSLLWFLSGMIALFISVWISDLSIIAIGLLVPMGFLQLVSIENRGGGEFSIRIQRYRPRVLLYVLVFVLVCYAGFSFIAYAKSVAEKTEGYDALSTFADMLLAAEAKLNDIRLALLFRIGDVAMSWHAVFFVASVLLLLYLLFTKPAAIRTEIAWRNFFFFFALLSTVILVTSHWVLANGVANRYFTVPYMCAWIAVLITAERYEGKWRLVLWGLLLLSAVFGAISSVFPSRNPWASQGSYRSLGVFKSLGPVGIIGNYWHSYNIGAVDPEHIRASPGDGESIRHRENTDSVLACSTIYVIQDDLLNSLPDTLFQFGTQLRRTGPAFKMQGLTLAPYRKVMMKEHYPAAEMHTYIAKTIADPGSRSGTVFFTDSVAIPAPSYLVFGPYAGLEKGEYEVSFALKAAPGAAASVPVAKIDVSYNHGDNELVFKELRAADFGDGAQYKLFRLAFRADQRLKNVEFRVLYLGGEKLWFDYVDLKKRKSP